MPIVKIIGLTCEPDFRHFPALGSRGNEKERGMQGSRPGPRPQGPYEDKRQTLTTRITSETRMKLEAAAAASGRSLSQEIELLLERALAAEEALGGPRISALFRNLIDTIRLGGAGLTDHWLDDPNRRRAVLNLMKQRLDRVHVEMAEKEQSTLENILGQLALVALDDQDYAQDLAKLHYKHIWHLRSDEERRRYCEAVERITGLPASELEASL
jgi:hypothetical protein